jgi:hypothetical protein
MPVLTTVAALKIVIVAQTKPAGPLFPSDKDCVEVDPINEVNAVISISPLLKPKLIWLELEADPDSMELVIVRSSSLKQMRKKGGCPVYTEISKRTSRRDCLGGWGKMLNAPLVRPWHLEPSC